MAQADADRLVNQARRHRGGSRARRVITWLGAELRGGQLQPGDAADGGTASLVTWAATRSTPPVPAPPGSVRLNDGSTVLVRPVEGADAGLLADGFTQLSPRSRELRFLYRKQSLSAAEAQYLTAVDHHDHEALGAISVDGRGVGVARYIRDADDPRRAEVAVTVVDEWHRRGVATELMTRLVRRAEDEGIRRFSAVIASDNLPTLRLLRKLDLDLELVGGDAETLEYEINLCPEALCV